MTTVTPHREAVRSARSVVIKVGTTALTTPTGMFDVRRLERLADAIESRMKAGSDVVIVSSGAIAAGLEPLGLTRRPSDLVTKQAAASVGQVALVNSWSAAFARYHRTVGQVLLTAHDIAMRVQHTNAQRTLDRLRALHAVAIVNENDTVATNEIRFGDNDRLSALVAHLVGADALVIVADAQPERAAGQLVGMFAQVQVPGRRVFLHAREFPQSQKIGDRSKSGDAADAGLGAGSMHGHEAAARCSTDRHAPGIGDAFLDQMIQDGGYVFGEGQKQVIAIPQS